MAFTFTPAVQSLYHDCENLRQLHNQVYLICRFEENDATLRAMWDAAYAPEQANYIFAPSTVPMYVPVQKQQMKSVTAQLLNERDKPVQGKAGILKGHQVMPATQQGGGHAEEFFLQYLMGHAVLNPFPTIIDVYISRIPCAETSPAWRFTFGLTEYALPAGCGPKLCEVIRVVSTTRWSVAYGEGYPQQALQAKCLSWVQKINGLPNADAHHISHFI